MTFWQLIFIQSKVNGGVYDGDRLLTRIGSGPTRLGFELGCVNFVEAFANTPNNRGNRARNNSNLQQRLDAKFWRSDEHGGMPTGRQLPAR